MFKLIDRSNQEFCGELQGMDPGSGTLYFYFKNNITVSVDNPPETLTYLLKQIGLVKLTNATVDLRNIKSPVTIH